MKRSDRIKLHFLRNWMLPGKERLSRWLTRSMPLKRYFGDGIVWLQDEDLAIHTSADNYIEWTILTTGTYEAAINKLIRISVRPGDICLDIGANIGLQSLRMAQISGETGRVYAFEPLAHLRMKMEQNLALNRLTNVTIFPFALSDEESRLDLHVDPLAWNQGTFSLRGGSGDQKEHVEVRVADRIPEISTLSALNFVKIDVEGFEFQVLRGLKTALTIHRPRIIFEYDQHYWTSAGQNAAECFAFLKTLGYQLYQITAVGCQLLTCAEEISNGNILCLPG